MERFLDAYFYVAKQIVTQQEFDVTVWRAATNDEERKELVAVQRVHWGDRRPAPRDLCNMAKEGHHEETILQFLSDVRGNTVADRLEAWLTAPYAGLPRFETAESTPAATNTKSLSTAVGHVFTRNEQDGFVNEEELTPEVDPPQEPTWLHLNMVNGRNKELQATDDKSNTDLKTGTDNISRSNGNPAFYIVYANGHGKFHTERTPSWSGSESVLMTLRELSDGQFVAKPSLNEPHVLAVVDDTIITYQINLVADHRANAKNRTALNSDAMSAATESLALAIADEMDRKAAVLRQLVASAAGPALTTGGATTAAIPGSTFTVAPNKREQHRAHFFGTIDTVRQVDHSALFLDCEFVVPDSGWEQDADVNHKCGVTHQTRFVSQTALASRYLDEDLMYTTAHHFNLPFELHCIADVIIPVTPRLVVAVWSAEGDRKQTLQGYGVVTLSAMPGQYTQTIELWKPALQARETLHSLFIGGSASLVNVEDVGIPYQRRSDNLRAICDSLDFNSPSASLAVNNRSGLVTESYGQVQVTWMCVTQRRYAKGDDGVLRARYGHRR